jgi:hypothetical protein
MPLRETPCHKSYLKFIYAAVFSIFNIKNPATKNDVNVRRRYSFFLGSIHLKYVFFPINGVQPFNAEGYIFYYFFIRLRYKNSILGREGSMNFPVSEIVLIIILALTFISDW